MKSLPLHKLLGIVVVIAIALWLGMLGSSLYILHAGSPEQVARWGQFGDAFGSVNSLFSGLALLGTVAAVVLQRRDLEESMRAQRESAQSQMQQSRIAALAAALESKEAILAHLKERGASDNGHVHVRDRDVRLGDVQAAVTEQFLEINEALDRMVRQLVPEYREIGPAQRS